MKKILESNDSLKKKKSLHEKNERKYDFFDITNIEPWDDNNYYLKFYDDFAGKKVKVLFRVHQTKNKEINEIIFQGFVQEKILKSFTWTSKKVLLII